MVYYIYIKRFFNFKNKIIDFTKKKKTSLSFLLFEIFDFEILDTNYVSPVNGLRFLAVFQIMSSPVAVAVA